MHSSVNLSTPRLVLERLSSSDLTALHAHWIEPEVRQYLWDGRVISLADVRDVIRTSDQLFEQYNAGLWSVRLKGSPSLIGCAGYWCFQNAAEPELLYSLSRAYWGRGLAHECANALVNHAFATLNWPAVQASADVPNPASLKLLRRLGMRPAGQRPGAFGAIDVLGITRDEWEAGSST